jgi:uncharacterized protein YndB with AHSA1/START domain
VFDFTESIVINAAPERVWDVMREVDQWWPPSNAEHISLEHLDDRPATEVGARLRIREKVAGIPAVAVGTITEVVEGSAVTWDAAATYRWLGLHVAIGEGVTWRIDAKDAMSTVLSAHVWATFPDGIFGRLVALVFTRLLNGIEKDREHARTELRYLKRTIEERT